MSLIENWIYKVQPNIYYVVSKITQICYQFLRYEIIYYCQISTYINI